MENVGNELENEMRDVSIRERELEKIDRYSFQFSINRILHRE